MAANNANIADVTCPSVSLLIDNLENVTQNTINHLTSILGDKKLVSPSVEASKEFWPRVLEAGKIQRSDCKEPFVVIQYIISFVVYPICPWWISLDPKERKVHIETLSRECTGSLVGEMLNNWLPNVCLPCDYLHCTATNQIMASLTTQPRVKFDNPSKFPSQIGESTNVSIEATSPPCDTTVKNMTKELLEITRSVYGATKISVTDKAYHERVFAAANVDISECKDPEAALEFVKSIVLGSWGHLSLSSVERREFLGKLDECKGSFKDAIRDIVFSPEDGSIFQDSIDFYNIVQALMATSPSQPIPSPGFAAKFDKSYARFRSNLHVRVAKHVCPSKYSIAKSQEVRLAVENAIKFYNAEIEVHVDTSDKSPSDLFDMLEETRPLAQI